MCKLSAVLMRFGILSGRSHVMLLVLALQVYTSRCVFAASEVPSSLTHASIVCATWWQQHSGTHC